MGSISNSGYYLSNRVAYIVLSAFNEVIGKNGANAILNLADLSNLIDNYPKAVTDREFEFADFSAICGAVEEMYGQRGGRGLLQRIGRVAFDEALRSFGIQLGTSEEAYQALPLNKRLYNGVRSVAEVFSKYTDQLVTISEREGALIYTIQRCACCWGRRSDAPDCFLINGLLTASLNWASAGNEFRVLEDRCIAAGDDVCEFVINKEPIK
ncbi:MAG TPA: 4-vinyl reductase [Longilinea sp.]|nr:4-vinyl reductase [Longilinea sp.]